METIERIQLCISKNPYELSNVEKSYPLQDAIREYLQYLEIRYKLPFQDLTHKNNFKKRKGETTPDFYIIDIAVIEAKNVHNHYELSRNNLEKGVIWRFVNYPTGIPRVLIISNPNWSKGAKEYVIANGVKIIELGFFVTYDNLVDAYARISDELPRIIFQTNL